MSLSLRKEKQVLLELFLKTSSAASKFDSAAFSNRLSSPFFIHFMHTWANSVPSQLSSIEYVGMVSKYKHGRNSEQERKRHGCRPPGIFSDLPLFSVCANRNTYFIEAIWVMSLWESRVGLCTNSNVALKGWKQSVEMTYSKKYSRVVMVALGCRDNDACLS